MFILTGFVGTFCLLLGLGFILAHLYYQKKGRSIQGRVVGIERYLSRSHSSNSSSSQIMYRPLIEFVFNGEPYKFISGGRNIIKYKIGENIRLLNLAKGAKFTTVDSYSDYIFGLMWIFFSSFALYHFITNAGSELNILLCVLAYFVIFYFAYSKLKEKKLIKELLNGFLSIARFETEESLEGREIFYNNSDIAIEEKKNFKVGMIMTTGMFILMAGMFVSCYGDLSSDSLNTINSISQFDISLEEVTKQMKRDGKLAGALFSAVMMIFCGYSFIYQFKTKGS